VQTAILEERMGRNAADALVALQAAEAALRDGERQVAQHLSDTARYTDAGAEGLWTAAAAGQPQRWARSDVWNGSNSKSRSLSRQIEQVAAQPRYIVEWLATRAADDEADGATESSSSDERIEIFRVTARGVGRTTNASAAVQSTIAVTTTSVEEAEQTDGNGGNEHEEASSSIGSAPDLADDLDSGPSRFEGGAARILIERLSWRPLSESEI